MTTFAPREESSRAVAAPMPLLAPVMRATFPAREGVGDDAMVEGWAWAAVGLEEGFSAVLECLCRGSLLMSLEILSDMQGLVNELKIDFVGFDVELGELVK